MRIKHCQMKCNCVMLVIQQTGKRMISQGKDKVSRGTLIQRALKGVTLIDHIPLNQSALERRPCLGMWLIKWMPKGTLRLKTYEWFVENCDMRFREGLITRVVHHERGTRMLTSSLAVRDIALEHLRLARWKRKETTHVIVIPRLFCGLFRPLLHNESDLVLNFPTHFDSWPERMFEPPILAFVFLQSRYKP